MSIFPTRILLAADGSEDAAHATEAAVELSKTTSSELHVVYVGQDAYSATLVYPRATDSGGDRARRSCCSRGARAAIRADSSSNTRCGSREGASGRGDGCASASEDRQCSYGDSRSSREVKRGADSGR